MSELLVTTDDLGVPDIVCGCGHVAEFHPGGPADSESGWHADWNQHLAGKHCPCSKTKDAVRLAHWDSVVRREVVKRLREHATDLAEHIDWSDGRNNYGDNEGYEHAARILRDDADAIESEARS